MERVGGGRPVSIDARIVAATNRDLTQAVREARFREDLYYRLAVVTILLPPLRERTSDLDLLSMHFFACFARDHGRPVRAVAEEVFTVLQRHPWPGNVRQLRNAAERAVVMADGEVLLPQHLPAEILHPSEPPSPSATAAGAPEPLLTLDEMAQRMIRRALLEAGNNVKVGAAKLGIHPNTLRRKLTHRAVEQS